ncbi:LPXTG cell wall anchor domain-containing protein, partial [Vagococcus sp.]
FAADGDVESEATVGFAEKTIKGEPEPPKKIVDPIKKGDGDDNGKTFYKILPKTGETSSSLVTYIGLALVLFMGALSYKTYQKRGER